MLPCTTISNWYLSASGTGLDGLNQARSALLATTVHLLPHRSRSRVALSRTSPVPVATKQCRQSISETAPEYAVEPVPSNASMSCAEDVMLARVFGICT